MSALGQKQTFWRSRMPTPDMETSSRRPKGHFPTHALRKTRGDSWCLEAIGLQGLEPNLTLGEVNSWGWFRRRSLFSN
jgi:hypothetical protein